jgi:hypothetical protein
MTKIGDAFPTDPLAKALGLGKNLLPNSEGGPFKSSASTAANAINSLPVPIPQPPITPANPQVLQAQQNFAQQTMGQKTVSDTILAGNTGGFYKGEPGSPGNPVAPKGFKRGL